MHSDLYDEGDSEHLETVAGDVLLECDDNYIEITHNSKKIVFTSFEGADEKQY